MGKQRNSDIEEGMHSESNKSETISLSSSVESPPRKKLKKRYKKSHKYKFDEMEALEDENNYAERKKHKHKHKKHKREVYRHRSEHYEETESYRHHRHRRSHRSSSHKVRSKHRKHNSEVESRSRHSSHRKRSRYHDSEERMRRDVKREEEDTEQQSSRWDDTEDTNSHLFPPIKTEPITDSSEEEEEEEEEKVNHNINNRVKEERRDRERPQREEWGPDAVPVKEEEEANPEARESINFGLSGKLTEDANTYNGVVVKYSQPPEARKPKRRWRWYIFKGDEELPFLPLHRQSAYLIGRERKVADIPTDHPSCSKQHAVFQYRLVSYEREDGTVGRTVKPYILDLGSANGTYVNNRRIDPKRYVELMEKDVVKFGYSSREYVLLHEASKGSDTELPDAEPELSPVSLLRSH